MGKLVGLYYDTDGDLSKISYRSNDIFDEEDDHVSVVIERTIAESLPAAENIQGRAWHHELNKLAVAEVAKKSPELAAKMQTQIAAREADIGKADEIVMPDGDV